MKIQFKKETKCLFDIKVIKRVFQCQIEIILGIVIIIKELNF